ncbi:hypothetical protein L6164_013486 [Bauhinia variegata]|uniref:Uncharacterized protein n=1 Tax=Bauhinia variegata TaxID=167791 RepID=A0ACB9NEV9_BAUVA|nr:hypothetical protein L6164_013486 [Bauhinia variegata]
MEKIVISIAAKIVEYTVAPIGQQVGYLLSYKSHFKNLIDQIEALGEKRESIKEIIEAERRNGKLIQDDVQNWVNGVDEIIEAVMKLFEDPRLRNVSFSHWSFPNLWWRHQLSRKANKMAKCFAHFQEKGKFERVGYLPALDGVSHITETRGIQNFESRISIIKDIRMALTDPKLNKIGVYGLGGVGKTTLVKQVAAAAKVEKLFDEAVMAFVTQTPNIKRIQGEIADLLGLKFNEETVVGRAFRLRERIKREKSILIILDDIWARLDLEEIGIPFENDHKGCKVVMTSRTQDVLQLMDTQNDFRVEVLSEEEAWNLFKVMAGLDNDASLQNIATEVAKKCANLPVLIVTMARALRNKEIHEWKDALIQLKDIDHKEMHEVTYSALELSYNRLESNEIKALFLICGMHGGFINTRDLLKYGLGLGIFQKVNNTLEDARNRLSKMIGALKTSCLLLEDNTNEYVKMHDIVRDVAISIAFKEQHVFTVNSMELKEWPPEDFLKGCSQIILDRCHIHKFPQRLDCPKLKLFYLNCAHNRSLEIPNSFFEQMRGLKVLDLTNINMHSLPSSLCLLTNLQVLCLDLCTLGDISAMEALKNLEILSLYKSSMTELPSNLGQLTKLRMLDLGSSGIDIFAPKIISSLTKLEELYMGNSSIKWEAENSSAMQNKNSSLAELSQLHHLNVLDIQIRESQIFPRDIHKLFGKLEIYQIFIGDAWEWSGENKTSKTLKLRLPTSVHLEQGIKALLRRVENLHLDEIHGISNVLYRLNEEGFPNLKYLHVQNNAKIKHIINSKECVQSQVSFPALENIVLQNLSKLETLCHGLLTANSFCKLKILKVKSCDHLKYIFSFSMVKGLHKLLEIDVSECNSLEEIVFVESGINMDKSELKLLRSLSLQCLPAVEYFHSKGIEYSKTVQTQMQSMKYGPVPFFSTKVDIFPNLEILKFSSINVKKIWEDGQLSTSCFIQNLTSLIIEDCGSLKCLFSSSMVGVLLKLKRLEIRKCHMMEEIIAKDERRNNVISTEVRVGFPKLETVILNDMQNLETIWHPQCTVNSFGRLKSVEVKNCEKIVNIFPSCTQGKYSSLETLTISDCGSLEEIFSLNGNETSSDDEEATAQLKNMTLLQLPKLKHIWSKDPQGILGFHNLQAVHVKFCQNLEYVFPLFMATRLQKLEELHMHRCGVKDIVANKEEPGEETAIFVFKRLSTLSLWNLCNLEKFYCGKYSLVCPSLREIDVYNCNKLKLFRTEDLSCREIPHEPMEQALFTVEEVIPKLKVLLLNHKDTNMILQGQVSRELFTNLNILKVSEFEHDEASFPYWLLQNMPNLERLVVVQSSFKELFQDEKSAYDEGQNEIATRLKQLTLCRLPELEHISKEGSGIDPVLEILEILFVLSCSSLKKLLPSSVTFSHLTELYVENCNGMVNLISSQTARDLVKLRKMKIKECSLLEVIVTEKEDKVKDEIEFNALKILELVNLPRLNRFSSSSHLHRFPLLEKVVMRQCPHMKTFSEGATSTPKLRKVRVAEEDYEWCLEGNLNATITNMFPALHVGAAPLAQSLSSAPALLRNRMEIYSQKNAH